MGKPDPERRPEPLASNIERLMEQKGFNARSLALAAGKNEWLVADILRGKSRSPEHASIEALAGPLGVAIEELTGEPRPPISDVHAQLLAEIADLTAEEIRATLAYIRSLKDTRAA